MPDGVAMRKRTEAEEEDRGGNCLAMEKAEEDEEDEEEVRKRPEAEEGIVWVW